MSTNRGPGQAWWETHLEAIVREGIGTKAYAQREGLPTSSLYYWRRRLKAQSPASPAPAQSPAPAAPARLFVPMRLEDAHSDVGRPVLALGSGLRLELSSLPSPLWLAQLNQALARQER